MLFSVEGPPAGAASRIFGTQQRGRGFHAATLSAVGVAASHTWGTVSSELRQQLL